jgi:hypothetical protein
MGSSTYMIGQLKELMEHQAAVIVATGTGQGRFDDFDADYQRNDRLRLAVRSLLVQEWLARDSTVRVRSRTATSFQSP